MGRYRLEISSKMKFVRNALQLMSQSARQQKIKTCPTSMVKLNLNEIKHAPISILSSTNPLSSKKELLGSFNQQGLRWYEIAKKHSTEAGDGGNSDISKRISGLVTASDVVVFMKGVPSAPRCGFSNAVCQIFRMHNVEIDAHDVLADEELRQGIKDYSDWPTPWPESQTFLGTVLLILTGTFLWLLVQCWRGTSWHCCRGWLVHTWSGTCLHCWRGTSWHTCSGTSRHTGYATCFSLVLLTSLQES